MNYYKSKMNTSSNATISTPPQSSTPAIQNMSTVPSTNYGYSQAWMRPAYIPQHVPAPNYTHPLFHPNGSSQMVPIQPYFPQHVPASNSSHPFPNGSSQMISIQPTPMVATTIAPNSQSSGIFSSVQHHNSASTKDSK